MVRSSEYETFTQEQGAKHAIASEVYSQGDCALIVVDSIGQP